MVDNFDVIAPLLDFSDDNYFYFVQILQRKKDNKPGLINGANNNSRLIKAYYINSLEKYEFYKTEIIEISKLFNARAGIDLNRKHYEKMCLQHVKKIVDQILNSEFRKAHKAYNHVLGSFNHEKNKRWILDIDDINMDTTEMMHFINHECQPLGDKYVATIPSKNGYHIIVKPFDLSRFGTSFPGIDIHKNNPTNLFIP